MSPENPSQPAAHPDDIASALAAIRRSKPEDYDGHTEFERLSPDARLTWLEAAVRFVQASKEVSRPAGVQRG